MLITLICALKFILVSKLVLNPIENRLMFDVNGDIV